MPAVEVVTIVNHSGKIISNGKHLISLFKEAKASYQEKKASIKAEQAITKGIKRSQTYDVATTPAYPEEFERGQPRRSSHDDIVSQTSTRRSRRSNRSSRYRSASQTRPALTERNLQTLSEVSSTTPSRPPVTYRSPYAETAPRDMMLSRPTLARAPTMPIEIVEETPVSTPRQSTYVHRSRSDPSMRDRKVKEIDMNLAYGNIPPDLESRVDLDPAYKAAEKERKARGLMEKIEGLLTEAHCLHHTASHIITHLQGNPEAAAAVALTLAELSALLGKMSPAFLGVIKGGSPAIFSLLASPQFLIAAGVTVGVTVVMFGGWKIIKRMREEKAALAAANAAPPPMAFETYPSNGPGHTGGGRPPYPMTEGSAGFDEALVLEEELSTIETWRRGIAPFGEDESADLELISPEADRAIRSQYGDDAQTVRTSRTHRTHRTTKSHRSRRERAVDDLDVPDRASSRNFRDRREEERSETGSQRSRRSHRSEHSDRTERSFRSKKNERVELKAIEDGNRDRENALDSLVMRPKKDNMLKALFKKKDKERKDRVESSVVLA